MITTYMRNLQQQRHLLRERIKRVPAAARQHNPWHPRAEDEACDRLFDVFHLIDQNTPCEGYDTDFQFGARTMREHWQAGLADIRRSRQHRDWLDMPTAEEPFLTHDVHRQ